MPPPVVEPRRRKLTRLRTAQAGPRQGAAQPIPLVRAQTQLRGDEKITSSATYVHEQFEFAASDNPWLLASLMLDAASAPEGSEQEGRCIGVLEQTICARGYVMMRQCVTVD
eukprot:gene8690-11295_t